MKILLTNDDGYNAPGIVLLKNKLSKYGQVLVVAPKNHMSGKSCSITINKPIKVEKIDETTFAVDGTPADCVCFGLNNLNVDFDIVISGCNEGWNVSWDTLFSGTIGAASQALYFRKPVVAFSAHFNFDIVDKYFDQVMEFIINNKIMSSEYILNVNFPLGDEVKGIKICRIHHRVDPHWYVPKDDGYLCQRKVSEETPEKDTDWYLIHHGYVAISVLGKTLGHDDLCKYVNEKIVK